MSVYKRGCVYWMDFWFRGQRYQRSSRQGNERVAQRMESTYRDQLVEDWRRRQEKAVELGCEPEQIIRCAQCEKLFDGRKVMTNQNQKTFCSGPCAEDWARREVETPTLRAFEKRFTNHVKVSLAAKPATVDFYTKKLRRLLDFGPLASSPLDRIDEALVESFIQARRSQVSPASVNRELATLKKLLRWAYSQKLINRVPVIKLLPGEGHRDFILSDEAEPLYVRQCPQPLRDAAQVLLDTGMRLGELRELQWSDVHLEPANGAALGYIHVRGGKSKNAKRNLSLTGRVREILESREKEARCAWVFVNVAGIGPVSPYTLDSQHARIRTALSMPKDFVLHSLRHTFGTRLGEAGADTFTIMKAMGHSSVVVSQKYVHPTPARLESAWRQLEARNRSEAKRALQRVSKARRQRAVRSPAGRQHGVPTILPTATERGLVM
ncbi:MAG: tyrosine-type recombinase/integrase [Acidobacteria bacterium]|nr:tyrosine-type recombinase/integrase [Acidobacteriota bacterium]